MKKILIFAGTTEGRQLSECLSDAKVYHTVCVATEYGEIVLEPSRYAHVHQGRMNPEEMKKFIREDEYAAVVDATHPYAEVVTENIRSAMQGKTMPYLRLLRELAEEESKEVQTFDSNEACLEALKSTEGNILLTTGSKELSVYSREESIRSRLYVRVLPGMESLRICEENGITGKQILALQGPFTTELNEAIIRQYAITCLVTKQSGKNGGYPQKVEAARRTGSRLFAIRQTAISDGLSYEEVCCRLERICGKELCGKGKLNILLAGAGTGGKENYTLEVRRQAERADVLLGAERLLADFHPALEKKAYYLPEQILPYLEKLAKTWKRSKDCRVVILFSGDSGFYSGCTKLYQALNIACKEGRLAAEVKVLPGISSVACFAARTGRSYQDAVIESMHGKTICNLGNKLRRQRETFLLMSGVKDLNRLGKLMLQAHLEHCRIWAGYQLSYEEEQILMLTPQECCMQSREGLYICLVENPAPELHFLTPGKPDGAFIRGKVPMTKEEVRDVSICKMNLHEGAVVYDIGSGTGSIAVEAALLSASIQVYAVEQKEEGIALIKANQEQFGLENITAIKATAPEGFRGLPVPTHAFIGGSGGRLRQILDALYDINPQMRIVMNAVSLETISEIQEILESYPAANEDIVLMQVSRSREAGRYHLMQAENPVWICAFDFKQKGAAE